MDDQNPVTDTGLIDNPQKQEENQPNPNPILSKPDQPAKPKAITNTKKKMLILVVAIILVNLIGFLLVRNIKPAKTQNTTTPAQTTQLTPSSGKNQNIVGQFCGGIAGIACPDGYNCKLDGNYPDASGTCIKNIAK